MKKVLFYTQGCRLNQAETATLEHQFEIEGFQIVTQIQEADIAIVNTCTVTENGDADTRRLVRKLNTENEHLKIALIGCQSQILKEKLLALQNVQWVIGNAEKMNIHHIIKDSQNQKSPTLSVEKITRTPFTIDSALSDRHHTRANLKIQDGCDFYCAFCVIPFARGPARSRVFEDLVKEAIDLVSRGHQELVLTGINLGTYAYEDKDITSVIQTLSRLEGLKRLRISSIEPTTIPEATIEEIRKNPICCNYFHIPIQSGSQAILEAMNRHYSLNEFRLFITQLENSIQDVCIGTDIIVGFPGETKSHFDETVATLLTMPIHYAHVFSYSERQFARSKKLEGTVAPEEIAKRSQILRKISQDKRQDFFNRHLDTFQDVLFEQEKNGYWTGLTRNYCRVRVKSDLSLKNKLLPVKCEKIEGQSIIGRLV